MTPRIETLVEKKLIGKRMIMSFADNKTFELWRSFMPRRNEIQNRIGTEFYSVQSFAPDFFNNFDMNATFEKWATVEVTDFDIIPNEMQALTLPGGLYAVFFYKGLPSAAGPTFEYIFKTWLPNSNYVLDNRLHFEILGDKFNKDSVDSEEEIWIPVKQK